MNSLNFPSIDLSLPLVKEKFDEAKEAANLLVVAIEDYWYKRYLLKKCYRCYDFDDNLNLREHFKGDVKVNKFISQAFDTKYDFAMIVKEIKAQDGYQNENNNRVQVDSYIVQMKDKIDEMRKKVIEKYFFLLSYYDKILQSWVSEILSKNNYLEEDIEKLVSDTSSLNVTERTVLCEYYLFKKNSDVSYIYDIKSVLWINEHENIPKDTLPKTEKRLFTYIVAEFNLRQNFLEISRKELSEYYKYTVLKSAENFIVALNKYSDIIIIKDKNEEGDILYKFVYYDPTKLSPVSLFERIERNRIILNIEELSKKTYQETKSSILIKSLLDTCELFNGKPDMHWKQISDILSLERSTVMDYFSIFGKSV
jgi:hypothetical protein